MVRRTLRYLSLFFPPVLFFALACNQAVDSAASTEADHPPPAAQAQADHAPPSIPVTLDSDGLQLHGRFFQAPGTETRPTLLLIPGWPGNPDDVLGMGARLMEKGINVLMVNPRGMHQSEGETTFAGAFRDIGNSLRWLRSDSAAERFPIDRRAIVLGGYSWGGGVATAYAATDTTVRRIISIAGNDHGEFIREFLRNDAFAAEIRAMLFSTRAPEGPIRFDPEAALRELMDGQGLYGLRENATELSDRHILLVGGLDDTGVTLEGNLLPFYRALKAAEAEDVTFLVYQDDHSFTQVRDDMATGIARWITHPARER